MLEYVELLSVTPSAATAAHVARLREVGFDDPEIFEIVMVTGYYALRCRMADGLGVEIDRRPGHDPKLAEAFAFRGPGA
jgi:alkylhydroperoxidase family enzyme